MALSITLLPLPAREELAAQWRALESRAPPNFFLSWDWIGSWLDASGAEPLLLTAKEGAEIAALALFTPHRARRHLVLRPRQLCLHETGKPALDRLTIEHNGFLIAEGADIALPRLLFEMLQKQGDWDELVLGGVAPALVAAAKESGLHIAYDRRNNDYVVSLEGSEKDWLDGLSRNTRAQIQQASRHAEQFGPLRLERAPSEDEALRFFDEMSALHEDRWKEKQGGAFSQPALVAFHRQLITRGMASGKVELLRAMAGGQLLGYLYNFISGKTVLNYQSGFLKLPDNRHRPGLVTHRLCIEQARARGFAAYDLLAGTMRYKQSIGQPADEMLWCRAQRPGLTLSLERAARGAKQRLTPRKP